MPLKNNAKRLGGRMLLKITNTQTATTENTKYGKKLAKKAKFKSFLSLKKSQIPLAETISEVMLIPTKLNLSTKGKTIIQVSIPQKIPILRITLAFPLASSILEKTAV